MTSTALDLSTFGVVELDANSAAEINGGDPITFTAIAIAIGCSIAANVIYDWMNNPAQAGDMFMAGFRDAAGM